MEEITIITIVGWSLAVIGAIILLLVGCIGFFLAELWRTIRDNRTKIDTLTGEHVANINRCKPKR